MQSVCHDKTPTFRLLLDHCPSLSMIARVVLSSCAGSVMLLFFFPFFSPSIYFPLLTKPGFFSLPGFCFSGVPCAARAARTPRPSFLFSFALVRHLANRSPSSIFLPFSVLLRFLFCFPWPFFYSFKLSSLQSTYAFE